ncbi:glycosyltransferase family 39 protein [Patescibacteria group bacterium]|nr:glycosyltransferase family 39 protein [Patescibacteria group bacterium]
MAKSKKSANWKIYIPLLLFFGILILGAFLRLYRINEYMTFLGDEGRDVLVVKRMIVDHKLTLLGPITSVGAMYMGPIYYYMMAPFLFLWGLNPVGPAVMVALFSIATIYLLFRTGNDFFNPFTGVVASFLYAISPLTITYGRSSWNPNVVPFFALLIIYGLLKIIIKRENRWLTVVALSLGILLQLHYVTFMFLPIILACLFLIRFRIPLKYYIYSVLGFLLTYSPFVLFELRHSFVNTKAVFRFLVEEQHVHNVPFIISFWNTVSDVFVRLFWRLVVISDADLTKIFILFLAVLIYFYWNHVRMKKEQKASISVIGIWFITGIIAFGIYRGVIYDYYFGSLFAVPFLITGIAFSIIWQQRYIGKIAVVLVIIALSFFNFQKNPLLIPPNNMLKNTEDVSRFVYKIADGKPYNFALIALRNSDQAYRYFLEVWGRPPKVIETPSVDPARKTVTNSLIVVCEDKVCNPLGNPLWEIAGFGRAEIVKEWKVVTVRVFLLKHYQG